MAKGLEIKGNENAVLSAQLPSYDNSTVYAGAAQRSAHRKKAASAFRTISEVADELGVKQHVLRFWETKFSQLKPLKRGGGRRYYRPEDIDLLKAVHRLLYVEGYTIKGVQKLLREAGKKQIIAMFSEEDTVGLPTGISEGEEGSSNAGAGIQPVQTRAPGSSNLTLEQREALEAVLAELKELRGMVKNRR
ncbi:MAG: MerR family transcriptional regulator [Alphaproteobacteria bacterium]|nr:MerR family transcriptional regulator [Alphaproteobacteria bacterium]